MKNARTSILRNESGMGILQMLILAGVSAAVLAAIGTSLVTMFKSTATVAQSLDARLFNEQTAQILSNDEICTDFLGGVTYDMTGVTPTNLPIKGLEYASGTKFISQGQVVDENLEIAEASVRYDPGPGVVTVVQSGVSYRIAQTVFKMRMKKRSSNAFVSELQPMEIRMFTTLSPANATTACSAYSSGSLACVSQGGIWNPASADGLKCIPRRYCQYAGSFSDAPVADGGFVNPLTGGNNCPAGFDKQISGLINKAVANGKYSVSNTPYRLYTCMSCGTPLAAQTGPAFAPGDPAIPYGQFNDAAYEAVATSDENNAHLAEADTTLAYQNWQDGVARSAQYQSNINSANASVASAQSAVNSASSNANWASQNVSNAQVALSVAQALNPPDPQAVSSAQASLDAANNDYTYYSNQVSAAQGNLSTTATWANSTISSNQSAKNLQDQQNVILEAEYRRVKSISDHLRMIAKCSAIKAGAHLDPSLPPDSCDDIPACPSVAPFGTVTTAYGSC